MTVDHLIPESLLENPVMLGAVLVGFGLPDDFDLDDFANGMPALSR